MTPCFIYTDAVSDDLKLVKEFKEPEVFSKNGDTLTLVNYKFAYGNRMSDAQDNPFSIQPAAQASTSSGSSSNTASASASTKEYGEMAAADIMPYPDYRYNYYGGYYDYGLDYYYDPFVERSYKTSCDEKGYYSYQTIGDWSQYSSYLYTGKSYRVAYNATNGQRCYYNELYFYWSSYGNTEYRCYRKSEEFEMQYSPFRKFAITAALIIGIICLVFGITISLFKSNILKMGSRRIASRV